MKSFPQMAISGDELLTATPASLRFTLRKASVRLAVEHWDPASIVGCVSLLPLRRASIDYAWPTRFVTEFVEGISSRVESKTES